MVQNINNNEFGKFFVTNYLKGTSEILVLRLYIIISNNNIIVTLEGIAFHENIENPFKHVITYG